VEEDYKHINIVNDDCFEVDSIIELETGWVRFRYFKFYDDKMFLN